MAERFINAAKDGYLDLLREATKKDLNTPDEDGITPTSWTAINGHLDALRLVVGRGGDVDKCDYLGLTALHHAARKGWLHIVTFLVNWGSNIYALDNDYHSALDLAGLSDKSEVVQYLDGVYAQQQSKNPKHAERAKEEALKQAERNIKRYEKLQEEAARRTVKLHKKMIHSVSQDGESTTREGHKKENFIKTLKKRIRGVGSNKTSHVNSRQYSDMAGLTMLSRTGRRYQKKPASEINGHVVSAAGDLSNHGDNEKHTVRSLSAVYSNSPDIIYVQNSQTGHSFPDVINSRPAVYDVFGHRNGRTNMYKAKSESDLLDSGVESFYDDDGENEDNTPGLFYRPGFGTTAFLPSQQFLNTIPSFQTQPNDHESVPNGDFGRREVDGRSSPTGSRRSDAETLHEDPGFRGPKELPWDQDEVDTLDDDEEMAASTPLEMFLWSAGLETCLHKFLQEKVDMDVLVKMSDSDLKEIGLPFGPRKKLLENIRRRQEVLSRPKYMEDSHL